MLAIINNTDKREKQYYIAAMPTNIKSIKAGRMAR